MPRKFEAEIKKTRPKPKRPNRPEAKDPDLVGTGAQSEKPRKVKDAPLKTVRGTPIIERQNG